MNKHICSIILAAALLVTACQKQSTSPDLNDTKPALSLPGEYLSSSAALTLKVTTDSEQEANDLFSPGSGGITVSGAANTTLRYLVPLEEKSADLIFATDNMPLISLAGLAYPSYRLTLVNMLGLIQMATFTVKTSAADSTNYFGSYSWFAFDNETRTLTADNVYFYTSDSSAYVIFDGGLTSPAITIPANTPTPVLQTVTPAPGIVQLALRGDSTFSLSASFNGMSDSLSGKWEKRPADRLAFVYVPDEGSASDTLFADYTLDSYGLTLTIDENAGPYLTTAELADMVPLLEMALGIESGSLDDLNLWAAVSFTKQTAKPVIPASSKRDLLSSPGVRDIVRYMADIGKQAQRLAEK